ncbi:MAG: DUF4397 domain-containing protein [Cyclobacteriaceae bacterium]|nr:DUF4397 domain-containing protein [Cyclobacteriaceae bacterium]
MKNIFSININRFFAIYMLISLCASCGEEYQYFPDIVPAEGTNIKFVHAASDTSSIEFKVNGILGSPGYGMSYFYAFPVTNYSKFPSGSLDIVVEDQGTETIPNTEIVNVAVTSGDTDYYTVALVGVNGNYEAISIKDNISSIPLNDKSYIRIVNFMEDSPNGISLELTNDLGSNLIASDVLYKTASAFVAVEPGYYSDIDILDSSNSTLLDGAATSRRTLLPNRVYTFYARGTFGAAILDRMINR